MPETSIMIRRTINSAVRRPSQVMRRIGHTSATGVPLVKYIFKIAVKTMMMIRGLIPRTRLLTRMVESRTQVISTSSIKA